MLDEKHRLEQEAFQIPAPPLRAAPAPMPPMTPVESVETPPAGLAVAAPATPSSAASGAANAAAPARREMSSEEITSALGELADLRDRGAISAEDYEAKKQDLLARL
jgi:hypothetical protein